MPEKAKYLVISPEVEKAIQTLREATPEKWDAAVRYTQQNALVAVLGNAVLAVVALLCMRYCWTRSKIKPEDQYSDAPMFWVIGALIAAVILFIAGMVAIGSLPELINPEGATIHRLL